MKRIYRFFAICLCICILSSLAGCSSGDSASRQYAVSCAESLQSKCKAPSSFQIESDPLVFTLQKEDYYGSQICYIEYSAQNSYGVQLADNAVFCNGTYLGSEEDIKDYIQEEKAAREKMDSIEERRESLDNCMFLNNILLELHSILLSASLSGDYPDYAEAIPAKQIMKALK